MNHETKEALAELEKTYKPTEHDIVPGLREIQKKGKDKPDSINAASYSSGKVEKILKSSLDLIPSLSPTVKIQIMGGKVCLRCKGKTLLDVVNIL
mgnify:CR=1 FL=1